MIKTQPVICLETGEKFESFNECARAIGVPRSTLYNAVTAKVLSQGGYTEWQAYQICKAFEVGVDADVIAKRVANPVLNHAQMRELRRIAVHTDFADHDASPYKKDVYKTLSNGEYTAEHLHQARELMKTTAIHDIAFPRDWLKLDSRQMEVVRHALKSDVPMDALEEYADGTYTADHMNVITMALTEGIGLHGARREVR